MRIKSLLAVGFLCSLSWLAQAQAPTQNQTAKLSRKETNKLAGRVIDQFFPADVDKEEHDGEKYSCGDVYRVDERGTPELIFAIYPEFPGRFFCAAAPSGWVIHCAGCGTYEFQAVEHLLRHEDRQDQLARR